MKSSHGSHDSALDIQREYEKEICLKFINLTGIDLSFYFDDNPNYKIPIRSGGKVPFTRTELYKARGHDRHRNPYQKTTFSLCIGDCKPIENINFQRNNYRQFKSFLQSSNGRRYPVYFGIKVENSGIMNVVTICPSLSFYNDTKFETMFLLINNPSIPNNTIIIPKETKGYVPLTWLMCDSPESQVSIKFSQNGQYTQLCNNISEFFVKAINDPHLLKERESEKNKVQKAFPNANNPTFIKIIDIQKSELDNRKDSKYLNVQDNGANRAIYLDYFLLQTKDINKLRESEPDYLGDNTNINNASVDMNASMSSLIPINNQIVEFDYNAPYYRTVGNGLSIQAICGSDCEAKDKIVYCRIGFVRNYDVIQNCGNGNIKCPACKNLIYPKNFGFLRCKYKIDFTKWEGNKPISNSVEGEADEKFKLFSEYSGNANFTKLIFTVTKK